VITEGADRLEDGAKVTLPGQGQNGQKMADGARKDQQAGASRPFGKKDPGSTDPGDASGKKSTAQREKREPAAAQ
jgi:hypothetical protein